ncbi:MAG: hypothetical protein KC464_31920, partial [Myxococcales bacterium]|nr:hypothetical protein [Myxococcales bacterium]
LVHGGVNRVAHDLLGLAQRAEGDLDAEQVLEDRGTRRLRWHSPTSTAISARTPGPSMPAGTPAGSSPQVVAPHAHVTRCRRYSVTSGWISGLVAR